MKTFFGDGVLLDSAVAERLYGQVKDLPIIDYHCHLDAKAIADDTGFGDISELWLQHDHYKWRAMRLCGVDEKFITGDADGYGKFVKYAEIMPKLIGNPLYYWTHFELKRIFGITEPLDANSAKRIYTIANEKLKDISVLKLLKSFDVRYIATTDDPCDNLTSHGTYDGITVAPTFRPDKAFDPTGYTVKLESVIGRRISTAEDYVRALTERLDMFTARGCRITDHGFEKFPESYATDAEAEEIFANRDSVTDSGMEKFFGWLLLKLAEKYAERRLVMQLHFAVIRNCNSTMFARCGADSGFDLIGAAQSVKPLVNFLDRIPDGKRPQMILYTLNDGNLAELTAVTGAFPNVRTGAAWWFNDTVEGIRRNLKITAEYGALGTCPGMLTDSRSFAGYVRFDFFRRILCGYIGEKVESGEYDIKSAETLARNICFRNAKEMLRL